MKSFKQLLWVLYSLSPVDLFRNLSSSHAFWRSRNHHAISGIEVTISWLLAQITGYAEYCKSRTCLLLLIILVTFPLVILTASIQHLMPMAVIEITICWLLAQSISTKCHLYYRSKTHLFFLMCMKSAYCRCRFHQVYCINRNNHLLVIGPKSLN